MILSRAFEVNADDVRAVMADAQRAVDESTATRIFTEHVVRHAGPGGRIERAALEADEMDEQTSLAHDEIFAILAEVDVLRFGGPAIMKDGRWNPRIRRAMSGSYREVLRGESRRGSDETIDGRGGWERVPASLVGKRCDGSMPVRRKIS